MVEFYNALSLQSPRLSDDELSRADSLESELQPELNPAPGCNGAGGLAEAGLCQGPDRASEISAIDKVEHVHAEDDSLGL